VGFVCEFCIFPRRPALGSDPLLSGAAFLWEKIKPRPGTPDAHARIGLESLSGSDRGTGSARNFAETVHKQAGTNLLGARQSRVELGFGVAAR
jgi:hypothetical protein